VTDRRYTTKVQSNGKLKRGPVVSIPNRQFSDPIPDSVLAAYDDAKLVLDDNDHTYPAYDAGRAIAVVWGPAVEGDWFVRLGAAEASRKPTRDAALLAVVEAHEAEAR
jgi:hypothetical protein